MMLFRKLVVLARLVEPTSIRVLGELSVPAPQHRLCGRSGERWPGAPSGIGETRSLAAYAHATMASGPSMVLYDATTLYFEAEDDDELRKVRISKERRVDLQIVVGLLVTPYGFPLEVQTFTDNTVETRILMPVLRAFQDCLGAEDLVMVADAGMLSAGNLNAPKAPVSVSSWDFGSTKLTTTCSSISLSAAQSTTEIRSNRNG